MSDSRQVLEGDSVASSSSSSSVLVNLANADVAESVVSDTQDTVRTVFEKLLSNIQLHFTRILPEEQRKIEMDFSAVQSASVSGRASSASVESEVGSVALSDEFYMITASQRFTMQIFSLIGRLIKHIAMLSVPGGDIDRQLLLMSGDMQATVQRIINDLQPAAADCVTKQRAVLGRLQMEMVDPVLHIPDEQSERLRFLRKLMDELKDQDKAYVSGYPKQVVWSETEFAGSRLADYNKNAPLTLAQYTIIRHTVIQCVLLFLQELVEKYQHLAVQAQSETDAEYARQRDVIIESIYDRLESVVFILNQMLTQSHVAEITTLQVSISTPTCRQTLANVSRDSLETVKSIFYECKEIIIFATSQLTHVETNRLHDFEELVEMSYESAFQLLQQSRMVIARAEGVMTGALFDGMGHHSAVQLSDDLHRLLELNGQIRHQKERINTIQSMLQEGLGHLQETLLSADERAKFDDLHASYQFTVEASRLAEAKVNTAGAVQENILRGYFQLLLPMSGVHTLRDAEATSRLVSSLVEQIQKDFCEVENLSKKLQQSNDYAQFLNKMDIRIEQRKIVALMSTLEQLTEQVNAIKDALHQHKDIKIAIQQFSILFACVRSQLGQLTVPLTVRAAVAEHLRDLSSIFEVSGFKDALNKMQDIDLSTAQRLQIADNCHQNIRLANGLLLCLCSKMSRHFEPATLVEVESRPADSDSRLAHFSTPSPISVTREASPRPASAVLPGKRSRHSSHSSPLAQFSVVAANPPLSQHSSKPPVVAKHFSTQLPPAKLAKGE